MFYVRPVLMCCLSLCVQTLTRLASLPRERSNAAERYGLKIGGYINEVLVMHERNCRYHTIVVHVIICKTQVKSKSCRRLKYYTHVGRRYTVP